MEPGESARRDRGQQVVGKITEQLIEAKLKHRKMAQARAVNVSYHAPLIATYISTVVLGKLHGTAVSPRDEQSTTSATHEHLAEVHASRHAAEDARRVQ